VIGIVRARQVVVTTPDELWVQVEEGCGLDGDEYRRYYQGTSRAVGIWLKDPIPFPNPVSLDCLRTAWPGFQPPRSFAYLSHEQGQDVWSHAGQCGMSEAAG